MQATELAVKETSTEVAQAAPRASRFTEAQIAASQLDNLTEAPDLSKAEKYFVDLNIEYWSPESVGEEKIVYIAGIDEQQIAAFETGEIIDLECVLMIEVKDGRLTRWRCASKKLVGAIKDAIRFGQIIPNTKLTPVCIQYTGIKKGKNNKPANQWKVTPIIVAAPQ